MRDPYLYSEINVLKNLLGIKDAKQLESAEADITMFTLGDVDEAVAGFPFDLSRLCTIHKHIFGDIYEWAGNLRTIQIVKGERVLGSDTVKYSLPENIKHDIDSACKTLNAVNWVELDIHDTAEIYAKSIAALWQIHPFREGNTRTIMTFTVQFAEVNGFRMDKTLLKDKSAYVRDALVKASDGEDSEYQYLISIFEDAIRRG
jgi:cell filamentation protein